MKELRNNIDRELNFDNLEEAKRYYMPNLKEFPEQKEYAKKIEVSETLEELASALNSYTDVFSDGRRHFVKIF